MVKVQKPRNPDPPKINPEVWKPTNPETLKTRNELILTSGNNPDFHPQTLGIPGLYTINI
jgi:hypothetical protein